jgi:multidrug efflux pump subunit AcrA (membrane-fusion protein)
MIVGNVFFAPKPPATEGSTASKKVQVYSVGKAAEISYQGKIEKSGVVKIVAQAPGIVSAINVSEGENIAQGTNILSLASNYSGGNTLALSAQIAGTSYQNAKDTYNTQKDIINKQKELADKNKDNADLMRQISGQSATDAQSLAALDQEIVDSINASIDALEASNVGGANDAAILQAKQGLSQFQAALNQTNASQKSLSLQANDTSNNIATLQHDIAVKQLDLQAKTLDMTLEVSRLQYNMALVAQASMYPSAPFSGVVDKIFVHVGDAVNPGTPLAQISGNSQHAEIVVMVPSDVARNISYFEQSTIDMGKKKLQMFPTSVSRDATSGTLYSVIYDLGDAIPGDLTDSAYVGVRIPIGAADTTNIDPFVPLDAVFQTQEEAFIYVVGSNNIAKSYKIRLGQIQGNYVEALTGVPKNAKIILNRNVIEGDKVEITR